MVACCPDKNEAIKTLKQLASAATGMVGALALNEALKATFKEIGPGAVVAYAVLASLLSIFVIGILKTAVEARAGGDRAQAMVQLFKVAFCLLSASSWLDVITLSEEVWPLLGIALGLTFALVIGLIVVFKLYDFWQSASCRSKCPGPCQTIWNCFFLGLVLWAPITFGFICGVAWNEFFSHLIKDNLGGGTKILVAFLYALLTIPLAIAIILITQRVKESGWCCCPGPLGQPCCGLENKIADPLALMFDGVASSTMAFAWNDAFLSIWEETTDEPAPGEDDSVNQGGDLWILIAYAVVATIFGVVACLLIKKCAS
ncbi:hypothetical protein DIPPA_13820 [Diplonema papillatum]|nr:hypothetical protein DIPPA_13820 [Diplonema papillatum]